MALLSQSDIEAWTGFSYTDMKTAGHTSTATEWSDLCSFLAETVPQVMARWCGVPSFETATTTEYHNGCDPTGENNQYAYYDRTVFLELNCATVVLVEENTSSQSAIPVWVSRTPQSSVVAGDYLWIIENELARIHFHNNIPRQGYKNVRVTYVSGYDSGSPQYYELRDIARHIATNMLTMKKKVQEAAVQRAAATRDFSTMFVPKDEKLVFTAEVVMRLTKYKRHWIVGMRGDY